MTVYLPFRILQLMKSLIFHISLKPQRGTSFKRSLPVYGSIGSNPVPRGMVYLSCRFRTIMYVFICDL